MERGQIQVLSACDSGRHKLEPRHDFERVGAAVKRTYLCDVCVICGHQVPRPVNLGMLIETGIVSRDEVRSALTILADHNMGNEHLEFVVRKVVAANVPEAPDAPE